MAVLTIDVFHHFPQPPALPASLTERLDHIMTTQAELAVQIAELTAQTRPARKCWRRLPTCRPLSTLLAPWTPRCWKRSPR
jgi:hypothetical protein